MELSPPVRAALTDAGLSDDDVALKTGDELRKAIGGQLTYELVAALNGQGLTIARWLGRPAKLPEDHLIDRNLEVLKLRIVDGLNFAAIGREVGLTGSRIAEILRVYFGVDRKQGKAPARILHVPAAAVPVLRNALTGRLQGAAESLVAALVAGDDWTGAWLHAQDVYWLLLEVQKDKSTEVPMRRRKPIIVRALRDYAEVDEGAAPVCDRLLRAMP